MRPYLDRRRSKNNIGLDRRKKNPNRFPDAARLFMTKRMPIPAPIKIKGKTI